MAFAAFRPHGQGRRRHRLEQGHRQGDRHAPRPRGGQGRGVVAQGAGLRGDCRGNQQAGGEAIVIPCNISHKAQCETLIVETRKQLGPVDVLVCNAASNPYYGPNEKLPDDVFMKVMQNNILSNMWLVNLCLPDMRAKKDGSIMIVSSIGGVRASTVIGAYCISKAADMQLARNLAAEYGPDNIRVNTIAPGLVTTDFARAL